MPERVVYISALEGLVAALVRKHANTVTDWDAFFADLQAEVLSADRMSMVEGDVRGAVQRAVSYARMTVTQASD